MKLELGGYARAVAEAERRWDADSRTRRLWARDAAIFSNRDEARWLGWLDLPSAPPEVAIGSTAIRAAVAAHPSETAIVLGMGGSSLWPDVLGRTWNERPVDGGSDRPVDRAGAGASDGSGAPGPAARRRRLRVLDSTVPDAVECFLAGLELERCLFFVSSKSGSTIEPNALFELIHARLASKRGAAAAGRHFVAITDPGSSLEARAAKEGFLGVALGRPDVGGRFSALSPFGLLPAAAMGLAPERLLERARVMASACGASTTAGRNPGVALGLALGVLAREGRDKLTLSLSPAIASFGGWIEQLVAESTGKAGQGILPISDEGIGEPSRYAADRVFVDVALAGDETADARATRLDALARAGHPVLRLELADAWDLGQAIFQWEMATAVVGSVLAQNPFDQPDVESAKIASREVMAAAQNATGRAAIPADLEQSGLRIYAATALAGAAREPRSEPARLVKALVDSLRPGDSFVFNVFLADDEAIRAPLARMRDALGARKRVATAISIGPRYLHSTGQLQKGGPNSLAGLQLWQSAGARPGAALAIPGIGGDFDGLAEAQALGDFRVLSERGRRMLGIDVGRDPAAGVERIAGWILGALA